MTDAFAHGGRCTPARLRAAIDETLRATGEYPAEIVITPEEEADLLSDAEALLMAYVMGTKHLMMIGGVPIRVVG